MLAVILVLIGFLSQQIGQLYHTSVGNLPGVGRQNSNG